MKEHCCDVMSYYLNQEDRVVLYKKQFREYGIRILDGGNSFILISYCPWCGKKLPLSLRDKWFDLIFALGLDPDQSDLPEEYYSDKWWIDENL